MKKYPRFCKECGILIMKIQEDYSGYCFFCYEEIIRKKFCYFYNFGIYPEKEDENVDRYVGATFINRK